jgi:hypothetical protein
MGRLVAASSGRLVLRGGANPHALVSISPEPMRIRTRLCAQNDKRAQRQSIGCTINKRRGTHGIRREPLDRRDGFGNNTPPFRSSSRQAITRSSSSSEARSARASACDENCDCKSRPVAWEDKMPVSPVPCCRQREGALALSRRGSRLIARPDTRKLRLPAPARRRLWKQMS